ncbi:serine/threonine-protein kinase [Georgenia muralis]|nr:serine/threonine-protein kinase [Georgenia muralis]
MTVLLAGRYRLERSIGRGGMAEVHQAHDAVLGRTVAVKTVDLAAAHDPTLGERLRREARATAALAHPGIVTVYDTGVDGDTAYIVMELLPGRDLAAVLREGPLPVPEALRVGEKVAGALAAAHAAGIVHRDVKPGNVIVDGESVTVVDFGIAAVEQEAGAGLTATGTTIGTAEYMAPEQSNGGAVSAATDMYAFGCLLVAMVTGRPPFTGGHPVEVLRRHLEEVPPRLGELRPEVPADADALVEALLAKDPASRPAAADAARVLAGARSGGSAGAAAAPAGAPTAPTTVLAAGTTRAMPTAAAAAAGAAAAGAAAAGAGRSGSAGATTVRRPAERRWVGPAVVVAAVLLLLAVVAWSLRPPTGPGPEADARPTVQEQTTEGAGAEPTDAPATDAPATEAPATEAPATEAPATEPTVSATPPADTDPVTALIVALPADVDVRETLLEDWDEVLAAREKDQEQKVADKAQDLLTRADELADEGRLDPADRDALAVEVEAFLGAGVLEQDSSGRGNDRGNGGGDDENDGDD